MSVGTWGEKITEYAIPVVLATLATIIRWVYGISTKIDAHDESIEKIIARQDMCTQVCHETRERIALSEQDRDHIHDALDELRADMKRVLWYVRAKNDILDDGK